MELEKEEDHNKRQEADRVKLLAIFPEEVWLKIFDRVDTPEELEVWSNVSQFWRKLLEPRKTQFLFPQVLKVLADNNYLISKKSPSYTVQGRGRARTLLLIDSLIQFKLLSLRLVCKMWRLEVDRFLETRSQLQQINSYVDRHHRNHAPNNNDPFDSFKFHLHKTKIFDMLEAEILPILSSELCQESNPFPGRELVSDESKFLEELRFQRNLINADPQNALEALLRYRALVNSFLEIAGNHFWYADIYLGMHSSLVGWYRMMCSYLQHLPNIRSLSIKCPDLERHYTVTDLVEEPPFPKLRDLELLCLQNVPRLAMNTMFATSPNVKTLIILRFLPTSVNPRIISLLGIALPVPIEEAEREVTPDFILIRDPTNVSMAFTCQRDLNSLPRNWNLQRLWLDLENCQDLSWPTIFTKLESYKNSLTELHLNLPKAAEEINKLIFWESSRSLLHLPKLKRLEIEVKNICSLDFLLGLMSLEYLRIKFNYNDDVAPPSRGNRAEVINFNDGVPRPFLECNIWSLIPSLVKVEMKFSRSAHYQFYNINYRYGDDSWSTFVRPN